MSGSFTLLDGLTYSERVALMREKQERLRKLQERGGGGRSDGVVKRGEGVEGSLGSSGRGEVGGREMGIVRPRSVGTPGGGKVEDSGVVGDVRGGGRSGERGSRFDVEMEREEGGREGVWEDESDRMVISASGGRSPSPIPTLDTLGDIKFRLSTIVTQKEDGKGEENPVRHYIDTMRAKQGTPDAPAAPVVEEVLSVREMKRRRQEQIEKEALELQASLGSASPAPPSGAETHGLAAIWTRRPLSTSPGKVTEDEGGLEREKRVISPPPPIPQQAPKLPRPQPPPSPPILLTMAREEGDVGHLKSESDGDAALLSRSTKEKGGRKGKRKRKKVDAEVGGGEGEKGGGGRGGEGEEEREAEAEARALEEELLQSAQAATRHVLELTSELEMIREVTQQTRELTQHLDGVLGRAAARVLGLGERLAAVTSLTKAFAPVVGTLFARAFEPGVLLAGVDDDDDDDDGDGGDGDSERVEGEGGESGKGDRFDGGEFSRHDIRRFMVTQFGVDPCRVPDSIIGPNAHVLTSPTSSKTPGAVSQSRKLATSRALTMEDEVQDALIALIGAIGAAMDVEVEKSSEDIEDGGEGSGSDRGLIAAAAVWDSVPLLGLGSTLQIPFLTAGADVVSEWLARRSRDPMDQPLASAALQRLHALRGRPQQVSKMSSEEGDDMDAEEFPIVLREGVERWNGCVMADFALQAELTTAFTIIEKFVAALDDDVGSGDGGLESILEHLNSVVDVMGSLQRRLRLRNRQRRPRYGEWGLDATAKWLAGLGVRSATEFWSRASLCTMLPAPRSLARELDEEGRTDLGTAPDDPIAASPVRQRVANALGVAARRIAELSRTSSSTETSTPKALSILIQGNPYRWTPSDRAPSAPHRGIAAAAVDHLNSVVDVSRGRLGPKFYKDHFSGEGDGEEEEGEAKESPIAAFVSKHIQSAVESARDDLFLGALDADDKIIEAEHGHGERVDDVDQEQSEAEEIEGTEDGSEVLDLFSTLAAPRTSSLSKEVNYPPWQVESRLERIMAEAYGDLVRPEVLLEMHQRQLRAMRKGRQHETFAIDETAIPPPMDASLTFPVHMDDDAVVTNPDGPSFHPTTSSPSPTPTPSSGRFDAAVTAASEAMDTARRIQDRLSSNADDEEAHSSHDKDEVEITFVPTPSSQGVQDLEQLAASDLDGLMEEGGDEGVGGKEEAVEVDDIGEHVEVDDDMDEGEEEKGKDVEDGGGEEEEVAEKGKRVEVAEKTPSTSPEHEKSGEGGIGWVRRLLSSTSMSSTSPSSTPSISPTAPTSQVPPPKTPGAPHPLLATDFHHQDEPKPSPTPAPKPVTPPKYPTTSPTSRSPLLQSPPKASPTQLTPQPSPFRPRRSIYASKSPTKPTPSPSTSSHTLSPSRASAKRVTPRVVSVALDTDEVVAPPRATTHPLDSPTVTLGSPRKPLESPDSFSNFFGFG